MARSRPRELSDGELGSLAFGTADSRAFRRDVLHRLHNWLDFDWYVWILTDPVTAVGIDPFAKIPDTDDASRAIRLKYMTQLNRWTTLTSVATYGGRADESALWREVQRPAGVVDVASMVFRDSYGCWGFLDLWSRRMFQAQEAALLEALTPGLTGAIRSLRGQSFRRAMPTATPDGPALILLDNQLTIVGMTAPSDAWLRLLLPTPPASEPIPAAAFNVAAQLLANEAGIDEGQALARMPRTDGSWARVSAARMQPDNRIAVSIETATVDERLDLFSRAHGLTPRENAVVKALAGGADTADVASALFLSPHTIQDHLKAVFEKTGVHRRGELLARAAGT